MDAIGIIEFEARAEQLSRVTSGAKTVGIRGRDIFRFYIIHPIIV